MNKQKRPMRKNFGEVSRYTISCPNCDSICGVRTSEAISNTTRKQTIHCKNPACGWQGQSTTEVTGTTHMPHPATARPDRRMPPMLSNEEVLQIATGSEDLFSQ
jgi:hypothetical protein